MIRLISFDSKQFISQVFHVALNLLSWVCFACFSQSLDMFCSQSKTYSFEFSNAYLESDSGLPCLVFR